MKEKRTAYKQAIMEVAPSLRNDIDNYVFALETRLAQLESRPTQRAADVCNCGTKLHHYEDCNVAKYCQITTQRG